MVFRCPCAKGWQCDPVKEVCVPVEAGVADPSLGSDGGELETTGDTGPDATEIPDVIEIVDATRGDVAVTAPCAATVCDDGNPCTDDGCDAQQGCTFLPNSATCTDGNACTANDGCAASACTPGTALACADGNPCTDDGCDAAVPLRCSGRRRRRQASHPVAGRCAWWPGRGPALTVRCRHGPVP
ncbi:MAG: hypothetical protein FJ100_22650 [Deltaproteobacteria bacterium]|nr:hypothetical protein [Deltaproteobacteria bacterium]